MALFFIYTFSTPGTDKLHPGMLGTQLNLRYNISYSQKQLKQQCKIRILLTANCTELQVNTVSVGLNTRTINKNN